MKKILLVISISILVSCKNDYKKIPNLPVYLEFNIMAVAPELISFGGFKEFVVQQNATERLGYGGILVFHTIDDIYCSFDLACPLEALPEVRVKTDNTGIARCDSCNSSFYVGDSSGFLISGKAKAPLKKYQTYYNSAFKNILVTN